MFKRLSLVFLFCFLSLLGYTQKENPRKYFNNVNKAELAIIDSNYQGACEYYKKAFKYLNEPFGKDIHNFLLAGLYANDTLALQMCYPKFVERKYKYIAYTNDRFKLSPYLQYLFENSNIKPKIDTMFVKLIDSLVKEDQTVRKGSHTGNDLFNIDSINMKCLVDYMNNNHVFIDENIIGNNRNCPFQDSYCWLILWHYSRTADNIKNPVNLNFKEKVIQGKLRPEYYAVLCDFNQYSFNGSWSEIRYGTDTKLLKNKNNDIRASIPDYTKDRRKLNKERKKIYLCSYEDYLKKLEYERKNMEFTFKNELEKTSYFKFINAMSLQILQDEE
ncbi:MAG TPA: hypothetical protein DD434_14915 [Bacteroidales bacterium]|nr:hypothetical protein [Bacteroidales bacterium]